MTINAVLIKKAFKNLHGKEKHLTFVAVIKGA